MKTTTDRVASAKKAWETMRANKAAGIAPASAGKGAAKPERDYSGLIAEWLRKASREQLQEAIDNLPVDAPVDLTPVVLAVEVAAPADTFADQMGMGMMAAQPVSILDAIVAEAEPVFTVIAPPTAKKTRKPRAPKVVAPVVVAAKRKRAAKVA
ncbi:MAG: hypothetical protein ABI806_28305 [Candidatus Solibacter sp.]